MSAAPALLMVADLSPLLPNAFDPVLFWWAGLPVSRSWRGQPGVPLPPLLFRQLLHHYRKAKYFLSCKGGLCPPP
eukprot:15084330-Alexandrium_andersonii.AAC.1